MVAGEDRWPLYCELALGLLEGEELREARHRVDVDPGARQEFAFWQARLAGAFLNDAEAPPAHPPARLRADVLASVGPAPAKDPTFLETLAGLLRDPTARPALLAVVAVKVVLTH